MEFIDDLSVSTGLTIDADTVLSLYWILDCDTCHSNPVREVGDWKAAGASHKAAIYTHTSWKLTYTHTPAIARIQLTEDEPAVQQRVRKYVEPT
jgi:hypothetical protein